MKGASAVEAPMLSQPGTCWLLYSTKLGLSLEENMSPLIAKTIYCISFSAAFNQARSPACKSRSSDSPSGNMVIYKSSSHKILFP
jgi:hypothetical protein